LSGSELILTPFEKALQSLQEVLRLEKTPIVRDAAIQRFEYTYELSWKFLRRWLELEGHPDIAKLPLKEVFRIGAERGLIRDPEAWFRYQQARNMTVHTYDQARAEDVYKVLAAFAADSADFLNELKKRGVGGPQA
jgi:nucleotidyltransferase substrate binding protein (TIGR01987 family)